MTPLTDAGRALNWSYIRAFEAAEAGEFGPVERQGGRLYVPADAVRALVLRMTERGE